MALVIASLQNYEVEVEDADDDSSDPNIGESEVENVGGGLLAEMLMKALLMMRKSLLNPLAETLGVVDDAGVGDEAPSRKVGRRS